MTVHIELAEHEAAMLLAFLRREGGYGGMTLIDVRSKVERALEWAEEQRETPTAADLRGLAPGLTGGVGAAEWVRDIRDTAVAAPTESELRAMAGDR